MKQCSWSRSVLLLVLVLVLNTVMMPSVVPPTPVFAATKDVVHCTDTDVALRRITLPATQMTESSSNLPLQAARSGVQ